MTRDLAASLLSLAALAGLTLAALLLSRARPTWRPVAVGLAAVVLLEALDVVALACGLARPRVFAAVALPGVLAAMAWGASRPEGRARVATMVLAFACFALAAALAYPALSPASYRFALVAPRWAAAALTLLAWAAAPVAPSRARTVALLLAGGNAVGLAGAWLLGEPARDWGLAQGMTCAEYAIAGVMMWREWRRAG